MIIAVALGLLIGLALGALGGGGSILAVPVLAHVAGQSAGAATTTSLVAVAAAAAVGGVNHARRRDIRWGAGLAFVTTGVVGSWAGTVVNRHLDGNVLLLAFSVLVLVAAHRMLTACPSCTNVGEDRALADPVVRRRDGAGLGVPAGAPGATGVLTRPAPAVPRTVGLRVVGATVTAGVAVGFLTGLFGVGGGFVIVPALTLALGLSMPEAIGTSLVIVVGNSLVALAFRGVDAVDWSLAAPFTATMLAGSLAGSLVARHLPPTRSLQAFASLLVLVAMANGVAATVAFVG